MSLVDGLSDTTSTVPLLYTTQASSEMRPMRAPILSYSCARCLCVNRVPKHAHVCVCLLMQAGDLWKQRSRCGRFTSSSRWASAHETNESQSDLIDSDFGMHKFIDWLIRLPVGGLRHTCVNGQLFAHKSKTPRPQSQVGNQMFINAFDYECGAAAAAAAQRIEWNQRHELVGRAISAINTTIRPAQPDRRGRN